MNENWIDYFFFFFFFTHVASSSSSSFFLSFALWGVILLFPARRTTYTRTVLYVCAVCHYIRIDPLFPNCEEEKKEKAEKMLLFYGRAVVKSKKKKRPSSPLPTHTITDVCVREWTWIPLLPIGSLIVYRHQLQQERKKENRLKIGWMMIWWWHSDIIVWRSRIVVWSSSLLFPPSSTYGLTDRIAAHSIACWCLLSAQ